jgi:Ca2+/Na+ antiporter
MKIIIVLRDIAFMLVVSLYFEFMVVMTKLSECFNDQAVGGKALYALFAPVRFCLFRKERRE